MPPGAVRDEPEHPADDDDDDIVDLADYHRAIDIVNELDDHPELHVDLDLGPYVLVRRDHYHQLVAAIEHYDKYGYSVNDIDDAARNLVHHHVHAARDA
jgi:hypothetical protein